MSSSQIELTEILEQLFQCCIDQKTGTFFISTEQNHSCQIVINQGELNAISLGLAKGDEAIALLKQTQRGSCSFKSNLLLPMTDEAKIAVSEEALSQLGFEKSKFEQQFVVENQVADGGVKPEVTYRGHVIAAESIPSKRVDANKPSPGKKPVRIYRGQVVKD